MDFIDANNLAMFSPYEYAVSKTFFMPDLWLMKS